MQPDTIAIKIGESGSRFLRRHHLPEKGHINKQPAGLNFYKHRWSTKSPGRITVEHGDYSFSIPHVLSVTGTEDVEFMDAGLEQFNFRAGITAPDTVPHDEARQRFMDLLQHLLTLGWKASISYNYPRLMGQSRHFVIIKKIILTAFLLNIVLP